MKYIINREQGIYRFVKPPFNKSIFPLANFILNLYPKTGNRDLKIKKIKIPTRDNKTIPCYILQPKKLTSKTSAIFYFHGGAFVYKGAPYHLKLVKNYAAKTNSVVIYVDYRPCYNTPFNTPLSDCIDAYKFFTTNAEKYLIDINKICIAGDSAGGYLALKTTLEMQETNVKPLCQMLIYPVVDAGCNTASMQTYYNTPLWNSKLNKKMWEFYLKGNTISPTTVQKNFSILIPTYI